MYENAGNADINVYVYNRISCTFKRNGLKSVESINFQIPTGNLKRSQILKRTTFRAQGFFLRIMPGGIFPRGKSWYKKKCGLHGGQKRPRIQIRDITVANFLRPYFEGSCSLSGVPVHMCIPAKIFGSNGEHPARGGGNGER